MERGTPGSKVHFEKQQGAMDSTSSLNGTANNGSMLSYIPGVPTLASFFVGNGKLCCGFKNKADADAAARASRKGRPPQPERRQGSAESLDMTQPKVRSMGHDIDTSSWVRSDDARPQEGHDEDKLLVDDLPQHFKDIGAPHRADYMSEPSTPKRATVSPGGTPRSRDASPHWDRRKQRDVFGCAPEAKGMFASDAANSHASGSTGETREVPSGQPRLSTDATDWKERGGNPGQMKDPFLSNFSSSSRSQAQPISPEFGAYKPRDCSSLEGGPAPHEDERTATTTSSTDECDEADFPSYAYALAKTLSKGRKEVHDAVDDFLGGCRTPQENHMFKSNFKPFDLKKKNLRGEDEIERLILDITVEKKGESMLISYSARFTTLVDHGSAQSLENNMPYKAREPEQKAPFRLPDDLPARGSRPEPKPAPIAASAASSSGGPPAAGVWHWPGWALDKKKPCIEVFVEDEDDPSTNCWCKADPISRVVDEKGRDTFLSARYYWDGESYDQDFGPEHVRKIGQKLTVQQMCQVGAGSPRPASSAAPPGPSARSSGSLSPRNSTTSALAARGYGGATAISAEGPPSIDSSVRSVVMEPPLLRTLNPSADHAAQLEETLQMAKTAGRPRQEPVLSQTLDHTVHMQRPQQQSSSSVPPLDLSSPSQPGSPLNRRGQSNQAPSGVDRGALSKMLREHEEEQTGIPDGPRTGKLDPAGLQARLRAAEEAELH